MDSNALVGLVSRNNVLCTTPDGAARDLSFLNYCIAVVMDKVLAVSIRTWLWDFLGVSLLVANKEDIKSKRYAVYLCTYIHTHALYQRVR